MIAMQNQPAILQVIPALVSGGAERGAIDVAIAARQIGWRSMVVSSGGVMTHELKKAGIPHFELPLNEKSWFAHRRNRKALQQLIEREKIDIVHARSRAPAWSAWQAVQKINQLRSSDKVHFVTTFHGTYNINDFGPFQKWKRHYNSIMTRGEKIIAVSDFIAEHIQQNYGIDPDKIVVIPRGVDLDKFNPDYVPHERMIRMWQEWHIPEHQPIILLPGRYTRWKGHLTLLEALGKIKDRDWFCVFLGSQKDSEDYVAALEKKIEHLDLSGRVRLLPNCRDMPAAYEIANIVVCPSIEPEAFGRVPAESQAMACLTIASGHGGAEETVIPFPDPDATGWLYPPDDIDALANTMLEALAMNDNDRKRLAARARLHIATHFTKNAMCAATLNVYQDVLNAAE